MTCTRRGAETINDCALRAYYPRFPPRAILPGDVESCSLNYKRNGSVKALSGLRPSEFPVFVGMRTLFTKNVNKSIDYVNSMEGVVEMYEARSGILRIRTKTGYLVPCTPWTDRDLGNMVYYPIKPGYASTILKLQGTELKKVCVYLDARNVPGGAYTALSRVSTMNDWWIGGFVDAGHFTPAR